MNRKLCNPVTELKCLQNTYGSDNNTQKKFLISPESTQRATDLLQVKIKAGVEWKIAGQLHTSYWHQAKNWWCNNAINNLTRFKRDRIQFNSGKMSMFFFLQCPCCWPWSWAHTAAATLCSCWGCWCLLRSPAAPGWFPHSPTWRPCAGPCLLYRSVCPGGKSGGRSRPEPSHTERTQNTVRHWQRNEWKRCEDKRLFDSNSHLRVHTYRPGAVVYCRCCPERLCWLYSRAAAATKQRKCFIVPHVICSGVLS